MPRKKSVRKKRTATRKKVVRKSRKSKPIGFVKTKGKYALVFGTKKKPRLGKKRFSKKSGLTSEARKFF